MYKGRQRQPTDTPVLGKGKRRGYIRYLGLLRDRVGITEASSKDSDDFTCAQKGTRQFALNNVS